MTKGLFKLDDQPLDFNELEKLEQIAVNLQRNCSEQNLSQRLDVNQKMFETQERYKKHLYPGAYTRLASAYLEIGERYKAKALYKRVLDIGDSLTIKIAKNKLSSIDKYSFNNKTVEKTLQHTKPILDIPQFIEHIQETINILKRYNNFILGKKVSLEQLDDVVKERENFLKKDREFFLDKCNEIINYQNKQIKFIFNDIRNKIVESKKINIENLNNIIRINNQALFFLKQKDFLKADKLYYENCNAIDKLAYEKSKSIYVKVFLQELKTPIDINDEQAFALSKISQNNLITARAGSGKTRTIAARTIFAIEKENIKPEEIVLLAFNKKAKEEIQDRIFNNFNYENFLTDSAKTFHSFAWNIVGLSDTNRVCFDDQDSKKAQALSVFVEEVIHSDKIWTESFKIQFYKYCRGANILITSDAEDYWSKTPTERYNIIKNEMHYTMKGEIVDNLPLKWIADYLFECGIKYSLNKTITQIKNKKIIMPIYIYTEDKKAFGLEFVDLYDQIWGQGEKTHDKASICEKYKCKYISILEEKLQDGRDNFEIYLHDILIKNGIENKKLDKNSIIIKLDKDRLCSIAKKISNFIQYALKTQVNDFEKALRQCKYPMNNINHIFIDIAKEIYPYFLEKLKEDEKITFDQLLESAIEKIKQTNGECEILYKGVGKIRIKDLKLILIDEYQDFSRLFYELIKSIVDVNPKVKLYCVGDNWQAINGFAGSNLVYFNKFKEMFKNSDTAVLRYNYRSGKEIVDLGNKQLQEIENFAIPFNTNKTSNYYIKYIEDVSMYNEFREIDRKFILDSQSSYFDDTSRCLKFCYNLIKKNPKKTYIIEYRTTNGLAISNLDDFRYGLIKLLKEDHIYDKDKIKVHTIHQFKGAEADTVILIDSANFFPYHIDNEPYYIFGKSPKDFRDEEKRLCYVAISRPKTELYLLDYLNGKKPSFITF